MTISDLSDEQLKPIIIEGIMKYRNKVLPNCDFGHEVVSVDWEILTHTMTDPILQEIKRVERLYDEIVSTLA